MTLARALTLLSEGRHAEVHQAIISGAFVPPTPFALPFTLYDDGAGNRFRVLSGGTVLWDVSDGSFGDTANITFGPITGHWTVNDVLGDYALIQLNNVGGVTIVNNENVFGNYCQASVNAVSGFEVSGFNDLGNSTSFIAGPTNGLRYTFNFVPFFSIGPRGLTALEVSGIDMSQTTVGAAGAASALPGAPRGYIRFTENVAGVETICVFPYWAAA